MAGRKSTPLKEDEPLWYKDAIIYQLHVRAFYDSDSDGVGDFRGLTAKLDYLQDLGVTTIWLLPFYPSPLRDDGYDISDYTGVHPAYGNLRDFSVFLREAHRRGLRVITELVLNHASDHHAWFQRARGAQTGSRWRNFFVWSDTPDRYTDARIIFKDFESSNWAWDPVAKSYYWHRFYSHQPDLNYDNPEVQRSLLQVMDFWLGMGVDGLRLDAVPYLFEREGTTCENLPETHAFLKQLRRYVDERYHGRMLLAEANQWPEDAAAYFGQADECHTAFHFPLMPRMFMAIRMEDRFPIIDILEQTPAIHETCQWMLFLRNHDELTLEMVTDTERDYMYRVYAQDPQMRINLGIRRRLAPLLGNDRRRIELMNGLLFSLPGTPVIYYGDELGMGDNIYLGDRNGVRTPMQWSADRNAGFSRANPQKLYLPIIIDPEYHYEAINVEAQHNNPHSLLWWMKRLIAMRKRFKVFGRGTLEFLDLDNSKVLAYVRCYEDERLLAVVNLSRFVQHAQLDLSRFNGMVPVELFGRTAFPPIGELPYLLTLGPHSFYWFVLQPQRIEVPTPREDLPTLTVAESWMGVFRGKAKAAFEEILPSYLQSRRWFGGKARTILSVELGEVIPVASESCLTLLQVRYTEGEPETYVLPLGYATGDRAEQSLLQHPRAAVALAEVKAQGEVGVLYDAIWERHFCETLLQSMARRRRIKGEAGELVASGSRVLRQVWDSPNGVPESSILGAEQSNTSVVFGDRLILKLFRRVDAGVNPDLEIGRFLTDRFSFPHIPPLAGAIEYRRKNAEPITVAILQGYVPNEGDAWRHTLDALGHYFEQVLALPLEQATDIRSLYRDSPLEAYEDEPPALAYETIGPYLQSAGLLGERTAELHLALASSSDDPNFAPESFTSHYQRSLYQSLRNLTERVFRLLSKRVKRLPESVRDEAETVLNWEGQVRERFRTVLERKCTALRIRCHGDYHLGQVLYTGKDFVIMDFEGEPARSLSERRLKGSPLRDVAGMLRSFHYAVYTSLLGQPEGLVISTEGLSTLETWAKFWYCWVARTFLKAYFHAAEQAVFLPKTQEELRLLLGAFLLEKAVYELGYELNNRPEWVKVPLQGIWQLVGSAPDDDAVTR